MWTTGLHSCLHHLFYYDIDLDYSSGRVGFCSVRVLYCITPCRHQQSVQSERFLKTQDLTTSPQSTWIVKMMRSLIASAKASINDSLSCCQISKVNANENDRNFLVRKSRSIRIWNYYLRNMTKRCVILGGKRTRTESIWHAPTGGSRHYDNEKYVLAS